jgi:hypothetical protein
MQGNGEFDVAKRETVRLLSELEPEAATPFGVVASDKTTVAFPPSLVPATSDDSRAVTRAILFVTSLTGGTADSCPDGALLAALEFVEGSCTAQNVIFYVGAGGGNCGGVEEACLPRRDRERRGTNEYQARRYPYPGRAAPDAGSREVPAPARGAEWRDIPFDRSLEDVLFLPGCAAASCLAEPPGVKGLPSPRHTG